MAKAKGTFVSKGDKKVVRQTGTGEFVTVKKVSKAGAVLSVEQSPAPYLIQKFDVRKREREKFQNIDGDAVKAAFTSALDRSDFEGFFGSPEKKRTKKPTVAVPDPSTYQSNDEAMAESLRSDPALAEDMLNMILEEGDQGELLGTLRQIAMAKGMAKIAEQTDLNRSQLYRTLSEHGNPSLNNFIAILKAMGLRLAVQPIT